MTRTPETWTFRIFYASSLEAGPEEHDSSLLDRLNRVRERIRTVQAGLCADSAGITLVVVTKTRSIDSIRALYALGIRDFGENRARELVSKARYLPADICWHFIGQLQSNKVREVLEFSRTIHSLDRDSLLLAIAKSGVATEVFIQINLTENPNRGGVRPEELLPFASKVLSVKNLRLLGVMAVADPKFSPLAQFERVANLSQDLQALDPNARFISAGMSLDFEEALCVGATHLRLGSAILGSRS